MFLYSWHPQCPQIPTSLHPLHPPVPKSLCPRTSGTPIVPKSPCPSIPGIPLSPPHPCILCPHVPVSPMSPCPRALPWDAVQGVGMGSAASPSPLPPIPDDPCPPHGQARVRQRPLPRPAAGRLPAGHPLRQLALQGVFPRAAQPAPHLPALRQIRRASHCPRPWGGVSHEGGGSPGGVPREVTPCDAVPVPPAGCGGHPDGGGAPGEDQGGAEGAAGAPL